MEKLKKNICSIILVGAVCASLLSCQNRSTFHSGGVNNDCSAMFETRYIDNDRNISYKKTSSMNNVSNKTKATECKILEVKIDNNTKCEVVGSDKIDNLSKVIAKNKDNRVILIVPENKIDDLNALTRNYFVSKGLDIKKHIDSKVFNNLNFPYKGMRCKLSGKEYVIWTGDEKVIMTIGKL